MIKEIEKSLVKYLSDNGITVGINADDTRREYSFIALSTITAEDITEGSNYQELQFKFNLVCNGEIDDILDKYLEIKRDAETSFTLYDVNITLNKILDATISMPSPIIIKAPFGNAFLDDIIITIRRKI